jgi:CubicO group peptidase (beta-lactamase class C family)
LAGVNVADDRVMRGFPPPREQRVRLDQVYAEPRLTHWYMQHAREVSRTADVCAHHGAALPFATEPMDLDAVKVGRAGGEPWTLAQMLRGTCVDGIAVLRRGRLVYEKYFRGMQPDTPHLYQSVTKALGSCVAANLVEARSLGLDDELAAMVPELAGSAYGDATLRHLLDMSVGIKYEDELDRPEYDGARLCRLEGVQPSLAGDEPGSAYDEATRTHKEGEHGAVFHYVSLNTFVLGWVMERATGVPVAELIRTHLWSKLGTEHDAYILLDGAGSAQLEGGFASSLRDMARFGLMLGQGGSFNGRQVVPAWWLDDVKRNGDKSAFAAAAAQWDDARSYDGCSYRSCFWVTGSGGRVSYSGVGWLGQRVYVDDEAGVVIAMFSSRPQDREDEMGAHAFQGCEDLARSLA